MVSINQKNAQKKQPPVCQLSDLRQGVRFVRQRRPSSESQWSKGCISSSTLRIQKWRAIKSGGCQKWLVSSWPLQAKLERAPAQKKSSLGRVPAFRAPKSGRWKFQLGRDWRLLKLAASWTPVGSLQTPTASCRLMLQAHGRSHMQKLKGHQPETFCGRPTGSD